jgi:hypothetical protein
MLESLLLVTDSVGLQVPENDEKRQGMLEAACSALAAACALPGVGRPLSKEEQKSPVVRAPTNAERAQALSLHALALHRHSDGSFKEAHDVRSFPCISMKNIHFTGFLNLY